MKGLITIMTFSPGQCEAFLSEISFFMDKSEYEQRLRLSQSVADLDEYWNFRLGTSAVRVALALNEYDLRSTVVISFRVD